MTIKELNLFGGIYYGNTYLNLTIPLEEQQECLTEDICQIEYKEKNSLIDIGWYPEYAEITKDSHFKIYIIQNSDWDNPIAVYSCYDISKLKETIKFAITELQNLPSK
ncbi:hypothetical protein ACE193_05640 [Bernardetia sp. OM2101]|uniref:hypothetical protein n=1 Tax=Bernardetia sp. OM2101 TaxID=3344876 RepID=UPI0035D0556E